MNYSICTVEELEKHLNSLNRNLNEEEINELKKNKPALIYYVSNNNKAFPLLGEKEKDDEEIVWAAIKYLPMLIKYASDRIKDNNEIIKYCIGEKGSLLRYASPRLLNNKKFILSSLKKSPFAYSYLSEEIRDNEKFFLIGSKHTSYIYQYASDRIKNSTEIMKKMCEQNFYFLLSLEFFADKKDWIKYIYEHPKFKEFDLSTERIAGMEQIVENINKLKSIYIANENERRILNLLHNKTNDNNNEKKKKI